MPPFLDASSFPHVFTSILTYCDFATLLTVRTLSKKASKHADRILFHEVVVIPAATAEGCRLLDSQGRPLPCPRILTPAARRQLSHVQVIHVSFIGYLHGLQRLQSFFLYLANVLAVPSDVYTVVRYGANTAAPLPVCGLYERVIDIIRPSDEEIVTVCVPQKPVTHVVCLSYVATHHGSCSLSYGGADRLHSDLVLLLDRWPPGPPRSRITIPPDSPAGLTRYLTSGMLDGVMELLATPSYTGKHTVVGLESCLLDIDKKQSFTFGNVVDAFLDAIRIRRAQQGHSYSDPPIELEFITGADYKARVGDETYELYTQHSP